MISLGAISLVHYSSLIITVTLPYIWCQLTDNAVDSMYYINNEERLLEKLFSSYNSLAAPLTVGINGEKQPVTVNLSVMWYRVIAIDEQSEMMSVSVLMEEKWYDPRLYWNPAEYGNLTRLTVPVSNIWVPDTRLPHVMLLNQDDGSSRTHAAFTTGHPSKTAVVEVTYDAVVEQLCKINLQYFPFDEQHCELIFGSKVSDASQITYNPVNQPPNGCWLRNPDEEPEGEWVIRDCSSVERVFHVADNDMFSMIFTLRLRRRYIYHLTNILAPTVATCLLNTIGIFVNLQAENSELDAAALGLTSLLSLSVLMLTVSDQTPKGANAVSLFGWFFITTIIQTMLVTVTSMYLRNDRRRSRLSRNLQKCFGFFRFRKENVKKFGNTQEIEFSTFCTVFHVLLTVLITAVTIGIGLTHP